MTEFSPGPEAGNPSVLGTARSSSPTGIGGDPALQPGLSAKAPVHHRCTTAGDITWSNYDLQAWSDCNIEEYRKWVGKNALSHVGRDDFKRDCADWALFCLVSFAKPRNLNIQLTLGAFSSFGPLARISPENTPGIGFGIGTPHEVFESFARRRVGAADFHHLDTHNCVLVARIEDLEPGDLITQSGHIQLVHANDSTIASVDASGKPEQCRVLEITQGNLESGPGGEQAGTKIVHKAWRLDAPGYYLKEGTQWKLESKRDFRKELGTKKSPWALRRWNFKMFSTAIYFGSIDW